ncbi:MAG: pitrilysin family protein [Candidatus Ozemobacteraceae bacterium]
MSNIRRSFLPWPVNEQSRINRPSSLLLLLVFILPLVGAVIAQSADQAATQLPKIEFEKYQLPNGLQVILHVDKKLPMVNVNTWIHAGAKNEKPGHTGFAHLFEHMMFQGSQNASGEYFTWVERAGANLREGGVNGTTGNDRTNYFATVPSGNLEHLLWLESDRISTLLGGMTQAKLDNQRDVVRNERRQNYENAPYGRAGILLFENLFPAGHPYSWPVIGYHQDLQAASLDDVKEFFKTYYTPNNLSLAIVGDFDPAEAKRLIEKYYGNIPAGPALARPGRWIPELKGTKTVEVSDRVPQPRLYIAWPAPAFFEKGEAELYVAAQVLSDGMSSRLYKTLVYEKQLCTDVSASMDGMEISGIFAIVATLRPEAKMEEVEQLITAELRKLAEEGPTEAELKRIKTKIEFGFISGLEKIGGFGGKADLLNTYNTYLGNPGMFDKDLARYQKTGANDVREKFKEWIKPEDCLKIRFRPETSGRASEHALDRASPPALGADKPFAPPSIKETKLSNGLQLLVVERPELPKVAVGLAVRSGNVLDQPGKVGVAELLARTITRGTAKRNAIKIDDDLADLGTGIGGGAGRESSKLSGEVLKRNLVPMLEIFSEIIREPSFPNEELERIRKLVLADLTQAENDPPTLAARLRQILCFGSEHPYGLPLNGYKESVEAISRDDLATRHRETWKPGNAVLIMAGDVTLEEAKALAETAFAAWPAGNASEAVIPEAKPVGWGKVYLYDKQDAAQTYVVQIMAGPQRGSPDYYALQLADAVWGSGGFGTRLNLNLREDKGYTYGARSGIGAQTAGGLWFAGASVQADKTKESLVEFLKELDDIAGKRQIGAEELEAARARKVRGYAQGFESLDKITEKIASLWALHLPFDEFKTELKKTQELTGAEINKAASTWAKRDQSCLLLIGDRKKIEAKVKELNFGEIVLIDAKGKPLPAK